MSNQMIGNGLFAGGGRGDGAIEVDGVPQDDGRGQQIEATCPAGLGFSGSIAQFTEAVMKDRAFEIVAAFSLVLRLPDAEGRDRGSSRS